MSNIEFSTHKKSKWEKTVNFCGEEGVPSPFPPLLLSHLVLSFPAVSGFLLSVRLGTSLPTHPGGAGTS